MNLTAFAKLFLIAAIIPTGGNLPAKFVIHTWSSAHPRTTTI